MVEGHIAPGRKLNERELAESLKVSRTPLREAIKMLAAEGLVELLPNRGAVVAQMSEQDVADTFEVTCKALYGLRKRFGEELKLYDPKSMHFSWVVEFPMFAFDKEENRWASMHHPFTAPRPKDVPLLETDPGKARAVAYDLVINGRDLLRL